MKTLFALLSVVFLASSCLKSLDFELDSNPLDPDYKGGFIVLDGYDREITFNGTQEICDPIMRFHLDPKTMERLAKIDMSDYEVRLNIKLKRASISTSLVQDQPVSLKKLDSYVLDSVYTAQYDYWWLNSSDNMICPEVFLTYKCLSCPPTNPYTGQTASQFLECFRCGG